MGALVPDRARSEDVIVAPATPPGTSALAVVRLSGPAGGPLAVLRALAPKLTSALEPWTAARCDLVDADGVPLDEAIALYFAAPRSPTGEEVVELSCHGSPAVVRGVLEAAVAAGARPAARGEFTRRALANGKLDLVRAEGIASLAAAQSRGEARRALGLLHGALSRRVESLREALLDALARVEASLDFAEEVGLVDAAALRDALEAAGAEAVRLAESGRASIGERWPTVAILGRPNAGKSTLFNALIGFDRAIVTAIPGTTRDAVSETVGLGDGRVRLVDTAGLRETDDPVESLGVGAARRAAGAADFVVYAIDGAEGANDEDVGFLRAADSERTLLVRTKRDVWPRGEALWRAWDTSPIETVDVAALSGDGIEALRGVLAERLDLVESDGDLLVLARHRAALRSAGNAIGEARAAAGSGRGGEPDTVLVARALREALAALGEITGETATEELLDRIFSSFCIGK